jgi:hypothetical protein
MIADEDIQLLDGYLLNKLKTEEKEAFEQRLKTEPELQQELQFQQQLVSSIQQQRVLQLKTMLNNVPAGGASNVGQSLAVKLSAGLLATGIIATGLYWFLNRNPDFEGQANTSSEITEINSPNSSTAGGDSSTNSVLTVPTESQELVNQPSLSSQSVQKTTDIRKSSSVPAISEATRLREEEALKVVSSTFVTSSREVLTDSNLKQYSFHYAFAGNKLILYGSFETNQYQILEFITKDNHIYFLQYKTDYYLLDTKALSPTPLSPIQDIKLIDKMRSMRN